jgi:phosphotriesterase-related protein
MKRRRFISKAGKVSAAAFLLSLQGSAAKKKRGRIMTVRGWVDSGDLGIVLSHEHILVDFIGAEQTGYHRWDKTEVTRVIRPYLQDVAKAGVQSFFECTPAFIGRDPVLMRMLSQELDMHLITNTGLYGARDNMFLPPYAWEESADQLAHRWIREWEDGIEDTGIRPGFIKIGIDRGPLSEQHEKLVRAAARAHLRSGLTIAAHTGTAVGAFEEFDVLKEEGVHPSAMIWVHAQAEDDLMKHVEAAKMGAWVSLDGVQDDNAARYVDMLQNMKEHGLLSKVLISHDAGWYRPGEPDGGKVRGYTAIFKHLLPALRENGFVQSEIDSLLIINPARAYTVQVRKV